MRVKYVGPLEAVVVPWGAAEYLCERDGTVEVPDDLGQSLLIQSVWEAVEAAPRKSATKEQS